jgi:serine/threonine-protein kinase RsbW
MGDKKSITVRGRYTAIRQVCEFVSEGAARAGFDEDAIFQVQLACDEACTNIIEHTYQDEDVGDITVSWEIGSRAFVVTIRDSGEQFNPREIPPAPVPPSPLDEDEFEIKEGGLGVYFMRKLMDSVNYSYKKGNGNILTMKKTLPKKGNQ